MSHIRFDADAYLKAGHIPWTFFAFPRALADTEGLPMDGDARRFLTTVQQQGVPAAAWVSPSTPDTIYFACPFEAREALNSAIESLEGQGEFEKGFLAKRSEHLFSLVEKSVEPRDTMDSSSSCGEMKPRANS